MRRRPRSAAPAEISRELIIWAYLTVPRPGAPARSLDHLIGAEPQRFGKRDTERLCRVSVEDHVELDRLLDRKVPRGDALENTVDVDRGHAIHLSDAAAVEHEAPDLDELAARVDRDEPMLARELDDR